MFEINQVLNSEYPIMVRCSRVSAWIRGHVVERTDTWVRMRKVGGGMITIPRSTIMYAQHVQQF